MSKKKTAKDIIQCMVNDSLQFNLWHSLHLHNTLNSVVDGKKILEKLATDYSAVHIDGKNKARLNLFIATCMLDFGDFHPTMKSKKMHN